MGKESIAITFFGFLGSQAVAIDSTVELGESIQNCNKDQLDVTLSGLSTVGNFMSHLGFGDLGRYGGRYSMISATPCWRASPDACQYLMKKDR